MKLPKNKLDPVNRSGHKDGECAVAKCASLCRLPKCLIALSILSAWGILPDCTSDPSLDGSWQREVELLQKLTLPPDLHQIDQHVPPIRGWGARADWEFDTNYAADAYYGWVGEKLRPDFRAYGSPGSPTRFSRDEQGDVEVLSVVAVPFAARLRVMVKVERYPD